MPGGILIVVKGTSPGKEFAFPERLTLGRSENNDVALKDDTVSRSHAEIKIAGGKFVLTDLGSHNGTTVNGQKVTQAELRDGDRIEIGATVFQFKAGAGAAGTAAPGKPAASAPQKGKVPAAKSQGPQRLVAVGLLIVLGAVAFGLLLRPSPPAKPATAQSLKAKPAGEDAAKKRLAGIKRMAEFSTIEDLLKEAKDRLGVGEKLYKEREITPGNLYRSVQYFEEVLVMTEHLTPRPDVYASGQTDLARAKDELDRQFRSLKFKIEQAVRLKEWPDAKKTIETLLASFPEPGGERHKYGRKQLAEVERHIKKRRGR